ncbi:MAG TPA: family 1 glycosylhydrolase [Methylibium sp.]|uniref:family 1 glycosylhydrolase n=1 Tax=Methylibium sp. TaxID=2067992 RepID=UPI002DBC4C3D|nr:family 1 glycosylhydrolase [Methylibium sp.]HEU4460289.1 family 1 glycosylhydrolase [Methylibium sp.]
MASPRPLARANSLALWGGVECTANRVQDRWFHQLERSGHAQRDDDLERFASLGIEAIRYPVLWERIAPDGLQHADWRWPDARLARLRELGLRPIVGLVHHGSGPSHTHLLDDHFPGGLADYARAVAERYPWVRDYTPVNEPLTTARFSALYGVWYPHARSDAAFVRAVLNQCRATVLAMRAIRAVNPEARLVQTDDLGKTTSRPALADVAEFYNQRRWLGWDLLCGRVDRSHPLHGYLREHGASEAELDRFRERPCPPDVLGVNYYITGERWLDERVERFAPAHRGGAGGRPFADIEVARALRAPPGGIGPLLAEAWARYRIPLAVTEAHIDANREDQLRWIDEIWRATQAVRQEGAQVEAVTVWALLGSFDWNCLVTEARGYYEPGAFDVRASPPRPTAIAALMRELAAGVAPSHPVLAHGEGWWRRAHGRFLCEPADDDALAPPSPERAAAHARTPRPLLVTGALGTLGSAFVRLCEQRELGCVGLARTALDIADPAAVAAALDAHRPWAVVNAGGYVRVDQAEGDRAACLRANAVGAEVLARACAARGIAMLGFSTDLVFDGRLARPYLESDRVAPLNVYGMSKAAAEAAVLGAHDQALMVRTSAFFGPWDTSNFLWHTASSLARGEAVRAADDIVVTPTYVPDLVHACLDLLIDRASGLWHLSNGDPLSWHQWAQRAARLRGLDHALVHPGDAVAAGGAARPKYSALDSERGRLLPSFDSALERFFAALEDPAQRALQGFPVAAR